MGFFTHGKARKERLLRWQNMIMPGSPDKLIVTEAQLRATTVEHIKRCNQILNDCKRLILETVNPGVFFERYDLMLEQLRSICALSEFVKVEFPGHTPSEVYAIVEESRGEYTGKFIHRFISDTCTKAGKLKTERGKISRYQKSYDELRQYYPYMSAENIELAEKAFPGIIKGGDIQ